MKRFAFVFSSIMIGFGALFALSSLAGAHSFRSGNVVSTGQEEVIDSTLFAAGRTTTIASDVNGDVFCAGQTVVISGDVDGDVICAAQTLTISGNVTGDIRIAGQTATVSGNVAGSGTVASETFVLESDGVIGRDLSIASGDATVNGEVGRDVGLSSGTLRLGGTVDRNIKASTPEIELASDSVVGGNIDYESFEELVQSEGAEVRGEITRTEPTESNAVFGLSIGFFIFLLVVAIVTMLLFALAMPQHMVEITNYAFPRPWKALLVGFLSSVAVPVALFFIAITAFGGYVALVGAFSWVVILFLSGIFSAFYIGRVIRKDNGSVFVVSLLGALALFIALLLPILGFFVFLFALWVGAGVQILYVKDNLHKPVYSMANLTKKKKVTKK